MLAHKKNTPKKNKTKKTNPDPKFYDLMKYEIEKAAWPALLDHNCSYGSTPD